MSAAQFTVRVVTHRSKPQGYEVYNIETRSPVQTYLPQDDEPDLSAALGRAYAHAAQLNGDERGQTTKD